MAAKGFLLLPLFLISVIRYYRSKIQTKIYFKQKFIFLFVWYFAHLIVPLSQTKAL